MGSHFLRGEQQEGAQGPDSNRGDLSCLVKGTLLSARKPSRPLVVAPDILSFKEIPIALVSQAWLYQAAPPRQSLGCRTFSKE